MTNPLALFEIIDRVGRSITLWERNTYSYDFLPKDLVAASMVNHAWHALLTPRLWEVFDSDDMVHWNIPPAILEAQSHHIRYLSLSKRFPPALLHSTQLRELTVTETGCADTPLRIIRANPSLTYLNITLPYFGSSHVVDEDFYAPLDSLSRLEYLELHWWFHVGVDRFVRILNNNPRLKLLKLLHSGDLQHVNGCLPLKHLTDLSFDTYLDANPGFMQLVRQCPSLVNLSFFPDSTVHMPVLARNLRECCPKLTSIQSIAATMELEFTGLLSDDHYRLLIPSSTHLERLDIASLGLTPMIYETLVTCHANWIRVLRVHVVTGTGEDLFGANVILQSCTQLESFEMTNSPIRWDPDDCVKRLFELPWNVPKLRSITLRGFRTVSAPIAAEEVGEGEHEGGEQDEAEHDVNMDEENTANVDEQGDELEEGPVINESMDHEQVISMNEQRDEQEHDQVVQGESMDLGDEAKKNEDQVMIEEGPVEAPDAEYAVASGWIAARVVPGWDNLETLARRRLLCAFFRRARTCHNLREITLNSFEYVRA
ncbi:hypothetical protein BG006_008314 [Podila minutissima]|uniref:F-box domain-containing protein n=1 Tax=Podila minutissima TaxID=64525 RepID=A0A9P5VK22_9FUNG|nr:hypothetical protein BG006_008314 [Podila minutissima]